MSSQLFLRMCEVFIAAASENGFRAGTNVLYCLSSHRNSQCWYLLVWYLFAVALRCWERAAMPVAHEEKAVYRTPPILGSAIPCLIRPRMAGRRRKDFCPGTGSCPLWWSSWTRVPRRWEPDPGQTNRHTQSSCLSTSARALLYSSLLGSSWNGISGTKLMCFTGKDNLFFLSSPNALFKIICDKKWTPPLWFSHHPWGLWALPPSVLLCWSCAEKPDNIKYLDFPIKNVHPAMFVTRDCWRKPWVRCCGCAECRNGQNSVTPVLLGLCVVPLEWEWLC